MFLQYLYSYEYFSFSYLSYLDYDVFVINWFIDPLLFVFIFAINVLDGDFLFLFLGNSTLL